MKSFQGKLPAIKYRITAKTGKGIRKFLESYGCKLSKHAEDDTSNVITVYCGRLYNYGVGSTGGSSVVVTPKEFKRIVRKAVGDAE